MEPNGIESVQPARGESSRTGQFLRKVVVPVNSHSSIRSSISSVRDQSSEYDTPATSVAVTPAESYVKEGLTGQRSAKSTKTSLPKMRYETLATRKRKRAEEDELMEADDRLAQTLQEEEYEEQPAHSGPKYRKRARVEDSEDEEPFSSSAPNDSLTPALLRSRKARPASKFPLRTRDSDEGGSEEVTDVSIKAKAPKPNKAKITRRMALPSRAARDSAKKSLQDAEMRQIVDSEDSILSDNLSDVSLFASDLDSDAFQASGDSDDDVAESAEEFVNTMNAGARMAAVSATPVSAVATSRRRRRAPATQTTNPNRSRRRLRGFEDRVCSRTFNIYLTSN